MMVMIIQARILKFLRVVLETQRSVEQWMSKAGVGSKK